VTGPWQCRPKAGTGIDWDWSPRPKARTARDWDLSPRRKTRTGRENWQKTTQYDLRSTCCHLLWTYQRTLSIGLRRIRAIHSVLGIFGIKINVTTATWYGHTWDWMELNGTGRDWVLTVPAKGRDWDRLGLESQAEGQD
jgi:hypothetical protein